jgi:phospholipid/cholesterol/gamma-HCH transport system permease protein
VGWLARLGRAGIASWQLWLDGMGLLWNAILAAFSPGQAAAAVTRRVTLAQIFFTAVQGLPFITAAALVSGATILLQTATAAPGMPGELAGKLLVAVLIREMAPLTTALIVASRSGTAMATEIGNMKAGLEVAALQAMGIDPLRFLILPRLVAMVVSVLVLTVYFIVVAVGGAFLMAIGLGMPSPAAMRHGLSAMLTVSDLLIFLSKSIGCGILIGWTCCLFGLRVSSSTTEVPQMTGKAVVRSVLGCVLYTFAITIAFYTIVGPPR